MQLERADQNLKKDAQIPVPDAKADEQEALPDTFERAHQAVGKRRPLGDNRDQEIQQVVLAENERAGFLGMAEQVIDQRCWGELGSRNSGLSRLSPRR